MGKPTGFLEYRRVEDTTIPPKERVTGYAEFHTPLETEDRMKQAARCMNCGVPFCQSALKLSGMVTGCPLHNLIPEWNDEIYHGHFRHALSRLLKTSSFPEFTGRVCPALCEKACINGMDGEPVTIHNNELFLIETGFAKGYVKPCPPAVRSGKRVAVVGSGPAQPSRPFRDGFRAGGSDRRSADVRYPQHEAGQAGNFPPSEADGGRGGRVPHRCECGPGDGREAGPGL